MRAIQQLTGIAVWAALLNSYAVCSAAVPILVYHRFGPVRADAMTVTTEHFRQQIDLLCRNNYRVIPLSELMAWRLGRAPEPAPRSVVLTFDDGHLSQYTQARPIILDRRLPVTLFIYPSCISNASYAMTWEQLRDLASTQYFDMQSHTYWHPNFKKDIKRLSAEQYRTFVDSQLQRSRSVLETKFNKRVTLLAWPFGIYDPYLENRASANGYEAAFTLDCRAVSATDDMMALPRCLISDECVGARFENFLKGLFKFAK